MSVDIFGRPSGGNSSRGPSGPPGPQGPKGDPGKEGNMDQMCMWMPKTILNKFREEEEQCCFLLTNREKDVKRTGSDIVEWISRCKNKRNIKSIKNLTSKDIIQITDERYALDFHNTLYFNQSIWFMQEDGGYNCVCVTFRVEGETVQTIVTNYNPSKLPILHHEIAATHNEIRIYGVINEELSYIPIPWLTKEWTTLFVEWNTSPSGKKQGRYIINDNEETGVFTCKQSTDINENGITIGGRCDKSRLLTGAICALEIYTAENAKANSFPDSLAQLIIKNQLIKNKNTCKRKREE